MDVLTIIGTVFNEMLIAVISVAAFVFLLREYVLRRNRFLLWFAIAFGMQGVALVTLFFGHYLGAYGHEEAAIAALKLSPALVSVKGFFAILGLVELAAPKRRWFYRFAALVLLASAVVAIAIGPFTRIDVSGMAFLVFDPAILVSVFGTWVVSAGILVLFFGSRIVADVKARREPSVLDRVFVYSGILGVIFIALAVISTVTRVGFLLPLNFVLLTGHLLLLLVGVAAAEHPDASIRKRPLTMFTKSLVFKAVGLNGLILWLLALGLLAITSSYFVSSSLDSRRASLRRDLHYFTKSYSSYSLALLEETSRFAAAPGIAEILTRQIDKAPGMMPAAVDDFMRQRQGARILRVIDADGVIVYSTYSAQEAGKRMVPSRVLEKALAGNKVAAIEREDTFGIWTLRAGVPITLQDGATVGVILDTDVGAAFDFSDYASISPIYAAGYGFVTEAGEKVFSSGQAIDALTRSMLQKHLGQSASTSLSQDDATLYLVERVYATDGVANGFFYIFLTNQMLNAELFRIISVVTLLVVLAVIFMTCILLFGMTVVLRPIRELRLTAALVEKENYDHRVAYRSPDELGLLADAFNRMETTIGDRTSALKEALREQQDFLDHTSRELRTPLNIFRWTLEMMRFGDTGRLNKEQLELIEQLHQTNERLIKMVQNLQDAIRIDQRRLTLRSDEVAIEDVIDEVAGALAVQSRKKGQALHWNRPKTPLPHVYADHEYLLKAVMNLVGNAVKYTPQNGHIEVDVETADEAEPGGRRGKFLKVTVEDNGIGIPKDQLDRLFTRFFRARNVVGGVIEGTGLGLYLTKQIIEMHDGAIWLESREGIGTSVAFTLPTEKPAPKQRPTSMKPS